AAFKRVSTLFLKSAGSFLIPMRKASAASVYSMNSCGTRAKFLLVICRLKSLETWTRSRSAVFTSSGDFNWAATRGAASASTNMIDAAAATIFFVPFIFHLFVCRTLECHMQNPVHLYGMAGSGTEKRIIAGSRCDELSLHGFAFAAHWDPRNDTRIVRRDFAVRLFRVLIHSFHVIGHDENPIMKGAEEFTRMMESEVDHCACAAGQLIGPEREEVTIRLNKEICNSFFGRPPATAC